MQKVFLANQGFERKINRERAKGYKSFVAEDKVESGVIYDFFTEGNTLVAKPLDDDGSSEKAYTILCKEFGLVGLSSTLSKKQADECIHAQVSVIFLDDGWMLVTLWDGGMVINLDDKLLMPTVNAHKLPDFYNNEILWVNAEYLLSYSKYLGMKKDFMYDFEFMFYLKGGNISNMPAFNLKALADEDRDISLGCFAQHQELLENKKQAKEAIKIMNSFNTGSSNFEFDDEEEEEEEEEDDWWDEEDDDAY